MLSSEDPNVSVEFLLGNIKQQELACNLFSPRVCILFGFWLCLLTVCYHAGLQSKKARGPPAKQTPYASLQHWYNQHVDVMVYYLGLFALSAMLYELHLYLTADRPLQPPPFP